MNIFYLSDSPALCAQYLHDVHVRKMLLETAQLLCTASRINLPAHDIPAHFYKSTHINHPCSIWVRESRQNFAWTVQLFMLLGKEYEHRFNKIHLSDSKFRSGNHFLDMSDKIIWIQDAFTRRPRCVPTDCQILVPAKDMGRYAITSTAALLAYRKYYAKHKLFPRGKPATWTNREIPTFIKEALQHDTARS